MRVANLTALYGLAIAALLGLTGCGGSSQPPAPSASHAPPRSLHTGRTLLIGGDELFDRDPVTLRLAPHDFGPCADNAGVIDGDSGAFLSVDVLDFLNEYPGAVVIVANEFELSYVERARTLDNLTSITQTTTVTGSRVVLVGVAGEPEFNTQLRDIARAYGARYSDTLDVSCPAS